VSKGFTKDDATDEPLVVPARAPLPPGATNYVTPRGLDLLRAELGELVAARVRAQATAAAGDADATRAATVLATRIGELEIRLAAAVLVDPTAQPRDEVRFGATVTTRADDGTERRYRIVGVDEADASTGRVAFVSPIARALLGKRVGDVALVRVPRGEDELEVVAVEYD
jgi:transcription elongation factor GreB